MEFIAEIPALKVAIGRKSANLLARPRERTVTKKTDNWGGKAAIAGAAIGSAALAAALLYTSRRKERDEAAKPKPPLDPIDTD